MELANAVWRSLKSKTESILAAEAPPGIGKTFALLAPAMLHLMDEESEGRILFLTAGITLQEQLIKKDLPKLNEILGLDMSFGLLKGRRNYVCLRQAAGLAREGFLDFNDGGSASLIISEWLKQTDTGDLGELPLQPNSPAVLHIASNSNGCFGSRCPFMQQSCFVHRNFRAAQDWKVVVANYHLFFSHALMGGFPVSHDILICDEAHRMSDSARSVSTVEASGDEVRRLLRARNIQPHEQFLKKYSVDSKAIIEALEACRKFADSFFPMLQGFRDGEGISKRDDGLFQKGQEFANLVDEATRHLKIIEEAEGDGTFTGSPHAPEAAEILNWKREMREFRQSLLWCLEVKNFPEWAYWQNNGTLSSAPVKCPETISQAISVGGAEKFFMVSATLAVEEDFSFWSSETGIVPDRTLVVGSPFDFSTQMQGLVVPIEERVGSPEYDNLVARIIEKLCVSNGGRTLVLLSSLRLLRRVGMQMRRKTREFETLVQGDFSQAELLKRFMEDETSVLIGSVSFREGVDIPGDGLTQVIIDRIPFPHPFDPLTQARSELERDAFMRVTLPMAKMFLRQAVGRLIRKRTDHGKVVILDGRVLDRPDWKVRECLPRAKFSRLKVKSQPKETAE